MRKGFCKLPFIGNPKEWMTLGMMKNRLYCRKRGDRFNINSSHNLELIKSEFIISEYYRKIDAIKQKKKIERSKSIPANLDKLPIVKNNINSLYLPSL